MLLPKLMHSIGFHYPYDEIPCLPSSPFLDKVPAGLGLTQPLSSSLAWTHSQDNSPDKFPTPPPALHRTIHKLKTSHSYSKETKHCPALNSTLL